METKKQTENLLMLKVLKSRYSQELIKKYKILPKNLPLL